MIREASLVDIVRSAIKKNARQLIRERASVQIEVGEISVYTDIKWCDFILSQILINAMQYQGKDPLTIRITVLQQPQSVILMVADNGIGISQQDLPRVFEKGFTGQTGRQYKRATGMGLYLCKKLCDRLGLQLWIDSETGKGTCVSIRFPKSDHIPILAKEEPEA